jgi:metallo-beta-lactamase class B
MIRTAFAFTLLLGAAQAQSLAQWRPWNKPVDPFRIIGNVYYVGAANVSSFAVKTRKGMILIDGGMTETAPQILGNLKKLGFKASDVKILLNSHAHGDHAGGLAELKRASGAKLYASAADTPALENGGRDDFAWGNSILFPAVHVDKKVKDGDKIALGGTELTAHVFPGHTKGCTTWTLFTEQEGKRYSVLIDCSLTVPGYILVNNAKYPNIADDYRSTFERASKLPADVFLSGHGDFFDLAGRSERLKNGDGLAFVDPSAYPNYVARSRANFEKTLSDQTKGAPSSGR